MELVYLEGILTPPQLLFVSDAMTVKWQVGTGNAQDVGKVGSYVEESL
jgi:hypothetical protein